MINRYIRLFGKDTIDCLLADREFVGCHWIKYLNDNNIQYYIRIRENFYIERRGKKSKTNKNLNCKLLFHLIVLKMHNNFTENVGKQKLHLRRLSRANLILKIRILLIRIERLFALVMVAFAWAYLVGIFRDEKVKPINILKHGDRAKSIIKYGLDYIARILSNPLAKSEFDICKFLAYIIP